jgi:hypothetical protein
MFLLIGVMFLSYPFAFLLNRGNHDALALVFTCAALFALSRGGTWDAGLLLAIAIAIKVYPALLILPLAARRQWRVLAWIAVGMLVLVLVAPGFWGQYVSDRLFARSALFRMSENASLVAGLWYLGSAMERLGIVHGPLSIEAFTIAAEVAYVLLLLSLLVQELRMAQRDEGPAALSPRLLLYFPFMVALPRLVYCYELVAVLPLIPLLNDLSARPLSRRQKTGVWVLVGGLVLTQLNAYALAEILGAPLAEGLSAAGLLVLLPGLVIVGRSLEVAPQPA